MARKGRRLVLLLGGERSGKSALAEDVGRSASGEVVFVATCRPEDAEMQARVEAHRSRRPESWRVVEEPIQLASALEPHLPSAELVIIDCLTLWASNILLAEEQVGAAEQRARAELAALLD